MLLCSELTGEQRPKCLLVKNAGHWTAQFVRCGKPWEDAEIVRCLADSLSLFER